MKGRAIDYLPEELAWIEARKDWPRAILHSGFCFRFGRRDVSKGALNALCKRNGWKTGRSGCFQPGLVPHNKGKPMPPETRAKVAPTMFKPGSRHGEADRRYKPIGTVRVTNGYLKQKVHDGMPPQSRWRLVHVIRWEAEHGPVPPGMALKCLDGNRQNTDPENWEAIPRGMLPRLAGGRWNRLPYDSAPDELKPTIMAIAKLDHAARAAAKEEG